MKFIELTECEIVHDQVEERCFCLVNPDHVVYVEEVDECPGYSFIGFVYGSPTIVKGTAKEIKSKLEGKKWHKILHRQ